MKLSFALLSLLPLARADGIPATSRLGSKLLANARPVRELNGERDITWAADYSIQFDSCHTMVNVRGEENGGAEGEGKLTTESSVLFKLCPSNTCGGGCSGGAEYLISLPIFVDAYTENRLEEKEYQCEMIRENCYCDNANDDEVCENQCYVRAGMEECIEYEGDADFEVQRYLECAEDENGNGYTWIGPTCSSDGKAIHLAKFKDAGCTSLAPDQSWGYYGKTLPYSSADKSMVDSTCISCKQVDRDADNNNNNNNGNNNKNNNNNNNEVELVEMCEMLYEDAAKCESSLSGINSYYWSPDNEACDYIHNQLPKLDKVFLNKSGGGSGKAAVALAWIFGISTLILGGVCFHLYNASKRSSVNLSEQGGTAA